MTDGRGDLATRKAGEYMLLYWDHDCRESEYVRGHVDLSTAEAILGEQDQRLPEKLDLTALRHRWARLVPVTGRDYDMQIHLYDYNAGRGSFRVTEVPYRSGQGGG